MRRRPSGATSAVSLPWNIGRANAGAPLTCLHADDVGDERAIERRRQRRREVARLIGVRKHDVRAATARSIDLLQRLHERVRRVGAERVVFDGDHAAAPPRPRARSPDPATPLPEHRRSGWSGVTGLARQLLRGGDRLPARAIELAVLLFGDDENHRTRASSRSRLTSSLAASAGEPPIITVCFAFCGA